MEKIGKYEVIRKIGQGGMGMVYQARDPKLNRIVAIKLMSEAQLLSDEMRSRFYREAQAAGNLKHPNIITIYDLSEEKNIPYIVMEYLEGKDLKQLLKRRQELSRDACLKIAVQVSSGLSFAHHHGVIHRDIKPANIRVLEDGQVKILDFGIARVAESEMTRTGHLVGTPGYMSPEQLSGKKVDERTDAWSLGVILYEMLAGRRPFEPDKESSGSLALLAGLTYMILNEEPPSFESLGVKVDEELNSIVFRALSKAPESRYADVAELGRDLKTYASGDAATFELRTEVERDIRKYLQLATSLLLKNDLSQAEEAARRALILDPKNTDAKDVLAQIARLSGKTSHAPDTDRTILTPEAAPTIGCPGVSATERQEKRAAIESAVPEDRPKRREPYWVLVIVVGLLILAGALLYQRMFLDPPPPVTGFVSVDIAPWAKIDSLKNLADDELVELDVEFTPCFLSLPEGRYEIQFSNPHFPQALTREVTVLAGEIVELREAIPGLNHEQIVPEF